MNKTLIAVIILALVAAGLYTVLTKYPRQVVLDQGAPQMAPEDQVASGDRAVSGTVISVETEQAMVDGPVLVTILSETEGIAVIAVPSMGLPTCAARDNMADAFALMAGDFVEVRGSIGEEGMIIPCMSIAHYLRVIAPS
ncbi:MAG: hypothetical protein V4681_00355 [Patescibacteria group bacterium]